MKPRKPSSSSALLLTVPEVADLLAVGETTVAKLIRHGELASLKIGRDRRIRRSAVETYIADLEAGIRRSQRRKILGRKIA